MARNAPQSGAQVVTIPAPVRGINAMVPVNRLQPDECIFSYNLIPSAQGLKTAPGAVTSPFATLGGDARSLAHHFSPDKANDRLLCGSYSGIGVLKKSTVPQNYYPFDVEDANLYVSFAATDTGNGYLTAVTHVGLDGAGANPNLRTLVCDEANGYHIYDPSGPSLTKVTQGTGVGQINGADPGTFAYVTIFKDRVWFIQRNTGTAWYLPVGQYAGTVTKFEFGNKFRHGGDLVALVPWTLDGGAGIDDLFLALSRNGDVIVYQGVDPSVSAATAAATVGWSMKGQYYLGRFPKGRRVALQWGADLMLLSERGVIAASKLVSGTAITDDQFQTRKIAPLIANDMGVSRDQYGWGLYANDRENHLYITTPASSPVSGDRHVYVCHVPTEAWGIMRGHAASCFGRLGDGIYYVDDSVGNAGMSWKLAGDHRTYYLDRYGNFQPDQYCSYSVLTAPIDPAGESGAGRMKRVMMVRPTFSCAGSAPVISARAQYDYSTSEIVDNVGSATIDTNSGVYPPARFGTARFSSGFPYPMTPFASASNSVYAEWSGVQGVGALASISLQGYYKSESVLIDIDVLFDSGGAFW